MKIKLKAWNTFSSVEVDVDMLTICSKDPDIKEAKYLLFILYFFPCLVFKMSLHSVSIIPFINVF